MTCQTSPYGDLEPPRSLRHTHNDREVRHRRQNRTDRLALLAAAGIGIAISAALLIAATRYQPPLEATCTFADSGSGPATLRCFIAPASR